MFSIATGLQLRIIFGTAKSRRQTTPNLIKNPRLAQRGLVTVPNKSYAYDLPDTLPNRHLYWNNTVQNRIRRKEYNAHRLYKLGIKSIHDDNGVPLHNRSVQEVLFQLSNLKLLKASLGRSLVNVREIAFNFPEVMKGENRDIVLWAMEQIHQRNLASMTFYQFSTYCYLRSILQLKATQSMLVHLYKWAEAETQLPSNRVKPKYFLQNMKYIFATAPISQENELLFKQEREFKLFEDVKPETKPFMVLLPKLFTEEQLNSLSNDPNFNRENYNFLMKIPGGKGLYDRIQNL